MTPYERSDLCLVTANLENDSVREGTEEPSEKRRLARPRFGLEVDHLRAAQLSGSQSFF